MSMFPHIDPQQIRVPVPPVMTLPEYLMVSGFYNQVETAGQLRNVLHDVEAILRRRVAMGEHEYTAVTLWIAHSYIYRHFDLTPRLLITSFDAGFGKTRLAKLITRLSWHGDRNEGKITDAVLGRLLKKRDGKLTMVLDQLDNALDIKAPGTGHLLDKLIAGADKGSSSWVNVEKDGGWSPERFPLFFPMVLVKIGQVPGRALQSRCITIQMHPATPDQAARLADYTDARLDKDIANLMQPQGPQKPPAKGKVAKVRLSDMALLPHIMAEREEDLAKRQLYFEYGLFNRALDKWRPLLTIAEAAGVKWTRRAHLAVKALEPEEEEQPKVPGANVLAKLMPALEGFRHPIMTGTEADNALGGTHAPNWRADMLKQVGLEPRRHYRDGQRVRGYLVEDIKRAAAQYLQAQDSGTPGTPFR